VREPRDAVRPLGVDPVDIAEPFVALVPCAIAERHLGEPVPDQQRRLAICLDGTWNSPTTERDKDGKAVVKPSNTLKLARAVLPEFQGIPQLTYYDSGVGGSSDYDGGYNRLSQLADKALGGAWGAGFQANIEQAARFIFHNLTPGSKVFIFGFRRGASASAHAVPQLGRRLVRQAG
jgi:uncharacterized protein (DUF2235 family)